MDKCGAKACTHKAHALLHLGLLKKWVANLTSQLPPTCFLPLFTRIVFLSVHLIYVLFYTVLSLLCVTANVDGKQCTQRAKCLQQCTHIINTDIPLSHPMTELSSCPSSLALPAHCVEATRDVSLSLIHFHIVFLCLTWETKHFLKTSMYLFDSPFDRLLQWLSQLASPIVSVYIHYWTLHFLQRRKAPPACHYPLVIPLHRHLLLFHRVQT